jgi:hypothetical protein
MTGASTANTSNRRDLGRLFIRELLWPQIRIPVSGRRPARPDA